MKNVQEFLDLYFSLHEASAPQDPQALAKATGYYQQAQSLPPTAPGSEPQKIPVSELQGSIYKNEKGQVVFDAFPGARPRRAISPTGSGDARQNFNDFVAMLATLLGGQEQAPQQEVAPEAGMAQPMLMPKDIHAELGFDSDKYRRLLGIQSFEAWIAKGKGQPPNEKNMLVKMLKTAFPAYSALDIKTQLDFKDGIAYRFFKNLRDRFNGGAQAGSLAFMLSNHVQIVKSEDGQQQLLNQADPELVGNVFSNIEKIVSKLSSMIRKEEQVSPEECQKFKNSIIPLTGSKILFNDRGTNTGIVISDRRGDFKILFDTMLKTVGCGLGEDKAIGSIAGAAAQIRGSFNESVQRLVIMASNCVRQPKELQAKCADKLSELFDDFKEKEDLLIKSLAEYENVVNETASIPIQDENSGQSLALATLYDKYGSKVPKVILKSLVDLARNSFVERRPDHVVAIHMDTKYGKKGDTVELWDDQDNYLRAMAKYGIDPKRAMEHAVPMEGRIGAEVSLKTYVTLKDGIGLGSVSENTAKVLLSGGECKFDNCSPEEAQEIAALRQGMAKALNQPWMADPTSGRYTKVALLQAEISKAEEAVDSLLEEAVTVGATGAEISVKPMEKFCKSLANQIKGEFSYDMIQSCGLLDKIDSYVKSGKSVEQLKSLVKNFLSSQILHKGKTSKDASKAQTARDFMLMSEFAAAGSRNPNTLISANGIEGGETYNGIQNDLLDPVIRFHAGDTDYSAATNMDGSETTYYGPGPDGNIVALYKSTVMTATSGRRLRKSHAEYANLRNLSKRYSNPNVVQA